MNIPGNQVVQLASEIRELEKELEGYRKSYKTLTLKNGESVDFILDEGPPWIEVDYVSLWIHHCPDGSLLRGGDPEWLHGTGNKW